MTTLIASFTTDVLQADFPLDYPKTVIFTNTSRGDYDGYMWRFVNGQGAESIITTIESPSYTIASAEQLPLTIELTVHNGAAVGNANMGLSGTNHKAGVNTNHDLAYDQIDSSPWLTTSIPPFTTTTAWYAHFNGSTWTYSGGKQQGGFDLSVITGNVIYVLIGCITITAGTPTGTLTISGDVSASKNFGSLSYAETVGDPFIPFADISSQAGNVLSLTTDVEELNVNGEAGLHSRFIRVQWLTGDDFSKQTGYIGPDNQYMDNNLGIDFVGIPRVGWSPLGVTFYDISITEFVEWDWSFGDGGVATTQHPYHTYLYAWPGY